MSCGTPILGARMGSLPELILDGVTGFLCDDVDEAVAHVPNLDKLDRRACRAHVENTFSVEQMTDRYCDVYRQVLRMGTPPPPTPEQLKWRAHDYWDRPQAFSHYPPRPRHMQPGLGSS
jgi:hypothetical protein